MNTDRFNAGQESLDASWCAGVRARLDREADALDSVTAARLAAARHRALAVANHAHDAQEKPQARWWPWLGSALAASLLLVMVLGRGPAEQSRSAATPPWAPGTMQPDNAVPPAVVESDIAVIADLEFYDWLEEQDALL